MSNGSKTCMTRSLNLDAAQTVPSPCRTVTSDADRLLLISGVVSPTSSSSRTRPPNNLPRAALKAAVSLKTSGVGRGFKLAAGSAAGATGVKLTPGTSVPGGRVTSARHVGHYPISADTFNRKAQGGLTSFRHFNNHSSHSSLWNTCPHGSILTISPRWKASMQIAHSSFEKYFFAVDFVRGLCLSEPLAIPAGGGPSGSETGTETAGGVRTSAGEIGGGPSVVGEPWSDSSESSFSHTISGVQTRSGRDKTTRGGARSASRCLDEVSCAGS